MAETFLKKLVEQHEISGQISTFCVVDIFAGTGQSSIEFLQNENVELVVSFTSNDKIKNLKENIYSTLTKQNIDLKLSIVESSPFNFQDLNFYQGASVFINLDENTLDIEKFFNQYEHVFNFICFYSKNNENLNIKENKEKNIVLFKKYDNIIIFYQKNDDDYDIFTENEFGLKKYYDGNDIDINSMYYYTENKKEEKDENKITWKKFCGNLSSAPQSWKKKTEKSIEDLKKFQEYIFSILVHICPENVSTQMVKSEYMPIWVQSVTHESYNLSANYEQLETYGDSVLGYSMIQYLLERFPDITPNGLTEYKNRYMAKEFQKDFSYQMQLPTWVLSEEIEIGININEDLFEAFAGALLKIGNTILNGLGNLIVFNFIVLVLSDTEFDKKMLLGKSITRLQQRGAMLLKNEEEDENDEDDAIRKKKVKGGIYEESFKTADNRRTVKVIISDDLKEYLKKHFHRTFDNTLLIITADTLKEATDSAWDKAAKMLEDVGYNDEFTQKQLDMHMFDGLKEEIVNLVIEKANLEKYTKLRLRKPKNTGKKGSVYYILSGLDEKGIVRKLSISKGVNALEAKEAALEKYVEN